MSHEPETFHLGENIESHDLLLAENTRRDLGDAISAGNLGDFCN
jgi:hypothetical protein